MKKITQVISLLALGLLAQRAVAQTSFAGYDWFDDKVMMSISGDTLVANVGTSSSSWMVYLRPENDPVVLANPGEKLVITVKFMLSGVNVSNTSQNFRIGILDTPGDLRVTTDDDSPDSGAYTGYAMFGNMGQVTDNSGAFQIRERSAEGGALSSSSVWESQDSGMGKQVIGYADDVEYTFTASIERTDNGSAKVDYSMTGGSINGTGSVSVSFLDGTPQPFVFDTLMFRPSNAVTTANTFTFTSFTVEAPEGTGGPTMGPGYFGNYEVITGTDGQQLVDTGAWLGWVEVTSYPWVYMYSTSSWEYMADPDMTGDKDAGGAWLYLVR